MAKLPPLLLSVFLLPLCGCEQSNGTLFNVTATLTETNCGTGVVDADDSRVFQVRLTKDDTTLTWYDVDSAESIAGTLSDGEFSVSKSDTYVITEASELSVGCSARRHDKYSGTATLDDSETIEKVEGTIALEFREATGYDCDDLIGVSDGFEDLPCEVDYDFVAKRD